MKRVFFSLVLVLQSSIVSAENINLWGTISWDTGSPAVGVEIQILKNGHRVFTKTSTNPVGRYGLYNLTPPTSDYSLRILRSGSVVKVVNLPNLNNGEQVPRITLPP
jgi:hypothetical protein